MAKAFCQPNVLWLAVVETLLMSKYSHDGTHPPYRKPAVATEASIYCPWRPYPIILQPVI
jgi:hypothetical protein